MIGSIRTSSPNFLAVERGASDAPARHELRRIAQHGFGRLLEMPPQQIADFVRTPPQRRIADQLVLAPFVNAQGPVLLRNQAVAFHVIERQGAHAEQPAGPAARHQGKVEAAVAREPLAAAQNALFPRQRLDPREAMKAGQDAGLPIVIAVTDGVGGGALLELDVKRRDIAQVLGRDGRDAETTAGLHLHQAFRVKMRQRLAQRPDADAVFLLQHPPCPACFPAETGHRGCRSSGAIERHWLTSRASGASFLRSENDGTPASSRIRRQCRRPIFENPEIFEIIRRIELYIQYQYIMTEGISVCPP
ncbi:MAG: hypothetical protein WDO24_19290 [Pseudomonadota bacterium]